MGKYMRNSRASANVAAVAEGGVRTRAKTLALQRVNKSEYMELRSRRLVKLLPVRGSRRRSAVPKPRKVEIAEEETVKIDHHGRQIRFEGSNEVDGTFGENNLDCESSSYGNTRESTPCSVNRTPPESPTQRTSQSVPIERIQNELENMIMPTEQQLEEFFAKAEAEMHRSFIEKYNFDLVNDEPLPGRYEWIKVAP